MAAKINKIIIDTILPLRLKEIGVFGSYARNEMQSDSDIDIMVDLDDSISLLDLGGLYMDLTENLENKIDLVTKNGVNEVFRKYIERDLISIYKNG
ncbi:nucleotidyltransferase family protein [Pricia sp.]|uniref:nucleotidyltransferase family protein n=1 Tax=Pricia sp. TaxID=2268138 RepID=UPI003593F691